jgi:NAD(P)H-dependent FMN reductase
VTIIAMSGSLRAKSFNTMLLHAAAELAPLEIASIKGVPLYDGDVEAAGMPAEVVALKDRVAGAKGLLLVTPEYNGSLPGTFKNAIDWMSRPSADIARVFGGLVTGVIGATPGPGGTSMAQAAWMMVMRRLGTVPFYGGNMQVSFANKAFDEHGKLIDATARANLEKYLAGFTAFVARHGR